MSPVRIQLDSRIRTPVRYRSAPCVMLLALGVVTSCDPSTPDPSRDADLVSVHDSASVRIVTDGRGEASIPSVSLEETEPTLEIGVVEGEEPYQFSSIGSVVPLPSGEVAVVDERAAEIRVFDSRGGFVRSLGGVGDGPGEFRRLTALHLVAPDILVAWDESASRLTWMTPRGEVQETRRVEEIPSPCRHEVEVLSNGATVVLGHVVDLRRESEAGVYPRADSLVVRIAHDAGPSDTIGRFPGVDRALVVESLSGPAMVVANVEIPFRHTTFVLAHGERVLIGRSDRPELRIFNAGGELEEIWRMPGIERELTPGAIEARAFRFTEESGRSSAADQYRLLLDHYPPPDRVPAFGDILSGHDGTVWLAEYQVAFGGTRSWWVLNEEGLLMGRVEVPTDLAVRAVANGVVYGVMTDELEVERVHRYEFDARELRILPNQER